MGRMARVDRAVLALRFLAVLRDLLCGVPLEKNKGAFFVALLPTHVDILLH
jgi:hypothetical protein